jgi:WD40 repeat protein
LRNYARRFSCHSADFTDFLFSIADPLKAELFTEHSKDVTVAKCSPSGCYVASGDAGGVVKIWALDNPEHPVKYEGQCLAGAICDIAWSPDRYLLYDMFSCFTACFTSSYL